MNRILFLIFQSFLSVMILVNISNAAPNFNDTIDGNMGTEWDASYTTNGDGTVTPGGGGQDFDIEKIGIYVDDTYLYIGLQTGFELNYQEDGETPGNIALGFGTMTGPESYQFALEFDFGSFQGEDWFDNGYDFLSDANLKLSKVDSWEAKSYDNSVGDSPFTIISGTEIGYLENRTAFNQNQYVDSQTGAAITTNIGGKVGYNRYRSDGSAYGDTATNNDPYFNTIEAAIRLDSLSASLNNLGIDLSKEFTANVFWTMSCNNDMLGASYTREALSTSHTPEPATLALFGLGLLGIGSWGRRQKNNAV